MDRDPTIHLEPDVPRCFAHKGCPDGERCARRRAAVPPNGRMEDFADARIAGEPCQRFIPIRRGYVAPVVERVVKDWPQGVE